MRSDLVWMFTQKATFRSFAAYLHCPLWQAAVKLASTLSELCRQPIHLQYREIPRRMRYLWACVMHTCRSRRFKVTFSSMLLKRVVSQTRHCHDSLCACLSKTQARLNETETFKNQSNICLIYLVFCPLKFTPIKEIVSNVSCKRGKPHLLQKQGSVLWAAGPLWLGPSEPFRFSHWSGSGHPACRELLGRSFSKWKKKERKRPLTVTVTTKVVSTGSCPIQWRFFFFLLYII